MANRFLSNITINDEYTLPTQDGTADQIISTDGAGTLSFIDPTALSVGESEQVHIACKNTSGVSISKGTPVYITGTVGTSFIIQIAAADASNAAKMPAVGLVETDLDANGEGYVIVSGVLKNLTTDPLSSGDGTPSSNDTIYVKAGGGLTKTKPTGSGNYIQNVGKVGRVNSSNAGSIAVSTIMRTNDVPNLSTGKVWVGTPTYTAESGVIHLDESNTRLGIGTTSPARLLSIGDGTGSPNIQLLASTAGNSRIEFGDTDDSDAGEIQYVHGSSNYMQFTTNGTEKMRIKSGGDISFRDTSNNEAFYWDASTARLGIGTTSPAFPLTIQANSGTAAIRLIGRASDDISGLQFISNDESTILANIQGRGNEFRLTAESSNFLTLYTGAAERLRIDTNGVVQVRNTEPILQLHNTDTSLVLDQVLGGLEFYGTDPSGAGVGIRSAIRSTSDSSTGSAYGLRFYTSSVTTNDVLRMNIWSSGDIGFRDSSNNQGFYWDASAASLGIGTDSPARELEVQGSGNVYIRVAALTDNDSSAIELQNTQETWTIRNDDTNNDAFEIDSSTTGNIVTIEKTGNVGIGTTSPNTTLHIADQSASNTTFRISAQSNDENFAFIRHTDYTVNTSRLDIGTTYGYSTEVTAMSIFNGKVGIGTDSPNATLDVRGSYFQRPASNVAGVWGLTDSGGTTRARFDLDSAGDSSLLLRNGSNTYTALINSDGNSYLNGGNVGIGTTSPDAKFHTNCSSYPETTEKLARFNAGVANYQSNRYVELSNSFTGSGYTSPALVFKTNANSSNQKSYGLIATLADGSLSFQNKPAGSEIAIGTSLGTQERMRIDSSGNVGIGESDPDGILHIKSDSVNQLFIERTGSITGKYRIGIAGASNKFFITDAEQGIDKLVISASGNIGIGTSSPANRLHVTAGSVGSTSGDAITHAEISGGRHHLDFREIRTANSSDWPNTTYQLGMRVDSTRHQSIDFVSDASSREHIDIKTGNQVFHSRFTFDGKLGIGNTSPGAKLDVNGAINAVGGTLVSGVDTNANVGIAINKGKGLYSNDGNNIRRIIEHTSGADIAIGQGGTALISNITLQPGTSGDIKFYPSGSQDVTFKSDGRVGIGTTSPGAPLSITKAASGTSFVSYLELNQTYTVADSKYGILFQNTDYGWDQAKISVERQSSDANFDLVLSSANAGSLVEGIRIDHLGNVGIGTTTPSSTYGATALDIRNSSGAASISLKSNGTRNFEISSRDGDVLLYDTFGRALRFGTSGGEKMRIAANGNVGINQTNPVYKLHVVGNSFIDATSASANLTLGRYSGQPTIKAHTDDGGYLIMDSTGGRAALNWYSTDHVVLARGGGNVGIGTDSPSAKLDVVGTIECTSLTETSALRFKENIEEDIDTSIIDKLRPVSYDWKETGDKDYGFIAEEVDELDSILTTKEEDGQLIGIKYTKLIPFLVKKIQEQEKRIKQLENGKS